MLRGARDRSRVRTRRRLPQPPVQSPRDFRTRSPDHGDVTETATSQAPTPLTCPPPPLTALSPRAHWRRRGSVHQRSPRLPDSLHPSLHRHGDDRTNYSRYQFESKMPPEEEEVEQEEEPLEQAEESSPSDPDQDSDVDTELEASLEFNPEDTVPPPQPKPLQDTEADLKRETSLTSFKKSPEPQCCHGQPLDVEQARAPDSSHRSIHVQTSKHLFWAEKHIQASEHSIEQARGAEPGWSITPLLPPSHTDQKPALEDTLNSKELSPSPEDQSPSPEDQCDVLSVSTQSLPLSPSPSLSSSKLPSPIGLSDVVNFASSLVMASNSKELPTLVKAASPKALEPSVTPPNEPAAQPSEEEPEPKRPPQEPPKKPLEAGEPQKLWHEEHRSFPGACLGFNKPGVKKATIEGEVRFLQDPQPQGDKPEQQWTEDQENPVGSEALQVTGLGGQRPLILGGHCPSPTPRVPWG
ncbi:spermatogenesis-associated protein 32 [Echinops telfairi]|uniref:Spermatogenesis-associated protein 32 n=1 Tax=Echinops telfairi TaxID=9371 RepID=A0AC55DUI7_ECHTE|nr:spermatogenesis-associated protein 32 [Echinops telfairi]